MRNTNLNLVLLLSYAVLTIVPRSSLAYDRKSTTTNRPLLLAGWKTNIEKRLVDLNELVPGGPGKDGIPAINKPRFIKPKAAQKWLKPAEPVISVVVNGKAKAYPLQILIWHEIANDTIADVPIVVTFCPLCYSANVFDRRINGRLYTFGVSGMLRHSDMVMYDHQTETLWQQITGQAIVGDLTGTNLKFLPAQIISFEQFQSAYKKGLVLSRKTGFRRSYGRNPYTGYDNISQSPIFNVPTKKENRLPPMEKLITVTIANSDKAYPYSTTAKLGAINDQIAGVPVAIFHGKGAVSALDHARIASSRHVGSTAVFNRKLGDKLLSFSYTNDTFIDEQTKSRWLITGQAIDGPLKGKQLTPIPHGDYFAFAWLTFKPNTKIYR